MFDSMFAIMEKSNDEEDEKKVTLFDLKQNLSVLSVKKLMNLASVLIDSIIELSTKKDLMNNNLNIHQEEKVVVVYQMSVMEKQLIVLETINLELNEKIKRVTSTTSKGKNEASSLPLDLENKLYSADLKRTLSLERNHVLERDLVHVKEELNKSFK